MCSSSPLYLGISICLSFFLHSTLLKASAFEREKEICVGTISNKVDIGRQASSQATAAVMACRVFQGRAVVDHFVCVFLSLSLLSHLPRHHLCTVCSSCTLAALLHTLSNTLQLIYFSDYTVVAMSSLLRELMMMVVISCCRLLARPDLIVQCLTD